MSASCRNGHFSYKITPCLHVPQQEVLSERGMGRAMSDPRPLFSVSETSALLAMESDAGSADSATLRGRWRKAGAAIRDSCRSAKEAQGRVMIESDDG